LGHVRVSGRDLGFDVAQEGFALGDAGFFMSKVKIRVDIALRASELRVGLKNGFRSLALLENLLRLLLVLPKIRLCDFSF
jgi:hypothetical protein